ncbi:uncharacterized protein V2V93DRAFT_124214 [Kockiozyma suomiensis]|uniref:uncharacterized protein n=1 Tax=Kockiozyma suomiensis TaxID=1337062 RepID=UPI00334317B2
MMSEYHNSAFGATRTCSGARSNMISQQQHADLQPMNIDHGMPSWATQHHRDIASSQMPIDRTSTCNMNVDVPDLYGSDFDDADDDDYDEFGVGDVLLDDSAGVWRADRVSLSAEPEDGTVQATAPIDGMIWRSASAMNNLFTAPSISQTSMTPDEENYAQMNMQYQRQLQMLSQHRDRDSMYGSMVPPPECPFSQTMAMPSQLPNKRKRRMSSFQRDSPAFQRQRFERSSDFEMSGI